MPQTPSDFEARKYSWRRELNRYQWLVVIVACLGWLFDTMAQQLFALGRRDAMRDLLGSGATAASIGEQAGYATSIFLIGWALGGVIFGVMGDRIGRVKTMTMTILGFTVFTGLSFFARGIWDFNAYRFVCGLGVGGQFGLGVALVRRASGSTRLALAAAPILWTGLELAASRITCSLGSAGLLAGG